MFADLQQVEARAWTATLHGMTPAALGERTLRAALCLVTDTLALASVGHRSRGVAGVLSYVQAEAVVPARGVVAPWVGGGVTPEAAALVTGALIHAWDFDDTFDAAGLHSGASVVSAALTAAAQASPSRQQVLAGVALGCEVAAGVAVGLGLAHRMHLLTCAAGAIAAAFTASYVRGLNAEQTWHAMGIAFSNSLAPRQPVAEGALTKRLQPGMAASSGVRAAGLAAHGVTGADGWWDGAFGLACIWEHETPAAFPDANSVLQNPAVAQLSMKPHACCRLVHSVLDAGRLLRESGAWHADTVTGIEVHLPAEATHDIVARAWSCDGETFTARQFSAAWTLALMLMHGEVSVRTLELTMDNHEVCKLASKVLIHRDLSAAGGMGPATVELSGEWTSSEMHIASPSGVAAYLDAPLVRAKARSVCGKAWSRLDALIDDLSQSTDARWDANAALATLTNDIANDNDKKERGA